MPCGRWGGTPAEVWTPAEIIEKDKELAEATANLNKTSMGWPWMPGVAYNGMIAPITRFNIAGAIWYQGESNVPNHSTYQKLLTTMIGSWRSAWAKEFPFYYVQIAPFNYSDSNINGALLQEAQTKAMSHPKTGMVVITDLVDSVTDIHPSHKREVGNRLASWALANTYGRKNVVFRSPEFEKAAVTGNKIELTFSNVPTSLKSSDKRVKGFMISDDGNNWLPAEAKINKNTITVWNKKIKRPVEVRYAFTNTLIGNVSSREGLPLTPFRSGKL